MSSVGKIKKVEAVKNSVGNSALCWCCETLERCRFWKTRAGLLFSFKSDVHFAMLPFYLKYLK